MGNASIQFGNDSGAVRRPDGKEPVLKPIRESLVTTRKSAVITFELGH